MQKYIYAIYLVTITFSKCYSRFMNPSSKTIKTKSLSVHESPYLRTQRVMNLKILNEPRNQLQLTRIFQQRSKKNQKNNSTLELFRFEISKSKDCVKRIQ